MAHQQSVPFTLVHARKYWFGKKVPGLSFIAGLDEVLK